MEKIKAPLLIHYAGLDQRINKGWPDYEAALKKHGKEYTAHFYPQVNHGFHNDTTPRYDEKAAKLAWSRTGRLLQGKARLVRDYNWKFSEALLRQRLFFFVNVIFNGFAVETILPTYLAKLDRAAAAQRLSTRVTIHKVR